MRLKNYISYHKICPMISIVLAVIIFDACSKSKDTVPPVNMSGNFDLVSDSIHNVIQAVTIYSYKGQSGDYWNFKSDSIYTKEGQQLDTLSLRLNQDSIFIGGIPFTVSSESNGDIKLQNIRPDIDFGGQYDRIIFLKPASSSTAY